MISEKSHLLRAKMLFSMLVIVFGLQPLQSTRLVHANRSAPQVRTEPLAGEVWVDDDYTSATPGWGVDHFTSIQGGINAVTEGGIVHVLSGSYHENPVIGKSLSLLGDGQSTTTIDGGSNWYPVQVNNTTNVTISGFTITGFDEWNNAGVRLNATEYTTVTNNHFPSGGGIQLVNAHHNTITNNTLGGRGSIHLSESWDNLVQGNNMHVLYPGQIFVMYNSRNNRIIGNTVVGDEIDASCTGLRAVHSSNNLYQGNVTRGFRVHYLFAYADNNIIANNDLAHPRQEQRENGAGFLIYHSNNNQLLNNTINDVIDGAITLFGASSKNFVHGNLISAAERGIELFFGSENNQITDNQVSQSGTGIVINGAAHNRIYRNNLLQNARQAYDNRGNSWSFAGEGNYWSDYLGSDSDGNGIGDSPYAIPPSSSDLHPYINPVALIPAAVPILETAPFEPTDFQPMLNISDQRTWIDETIVLTQSLTIQNGGYLKLDNVELYDRAREKESYQPARILVEPGGRLEIIDSELYGKGSYIRSEGALRVENSALYGFGSWDADAAINLDGDGAVIVNSVIEDSFTGILINNGSSDHTITGNRISQTLNGFRVCCEPASGSTISQNEIADIVNEAIFANGLANSTISGNVFQDISDEGLMLMPCGVDCLSSGNTIFENGFFDYLQPPNAEDDNDWSLGTRGNYYDDYLARYPGALPHASLSGVWDTPYDISGGDDVDPFPLIAPNLEPQIWTLEAHEITPLGATLKAYFSLMGSDSGLVDFQYQRLGESTWTRAAAKGFSASGMHSAVLADMLPDSEYQFRARVRTNNTEVTSEPSNFKTGSTIAYFSGLPRAGLVPLEVSFSAATGQPAAYAWDFGDGTTSTLRSPTHIYAQPGTYHVTLQVVQGTESETLERREYIQVWKTQLFLPLVK